MAHWRGAGSNGQRAIGQYQTGGILAIDAATNTAKWNTPYGTDMGHGQNPLSTAGDLVFVGMVDGYFLALDAATGKELWRFQTGSAISAGPITYTINGEQYVAVFAGGGSLPYGNSVPRGDALWAFKLGGTYKTASGSSEAPTPPLVTVRRPVGGMPVEGQHGEQHGVSRARIADRGHGRGPRRCERERDECRRICACLWARR